MIKQLPQENLRSQRNNILDLSEPESYTCNVEQYRAGHPTLRLEVYKGRFTSSDDRFHAIFTGVVFFDGPMQWAGANFCVASTEEWLALMRKLGWMEGAPQDALNDLYEDLRLFTVESQAPSYKIRIVATNVLKYHHKPEGFESDSSVY